MRYKTKYRAIQCDTKPNTERYGARRSQTAVDTNTERCNVRRDAIRGRTMRDGLEWQYKFKYRAIQYKTNTEPNNEVPIQIQSDTTQDDLRWQSVQIQSAATRQVVQCNTVSDLGRYKYRAMRYNTKDRAIQCDTTQSAAKARRSQMVVKTDRVVQCDTKPERWMCEKSGFKT